jgi:DNA-directed RNA polymerase subunit RPC12/RpoP
MPTSILDALEDRSDVSWARARWDASDIPPDAPRCDSGIACPSCGSGNVAQVLGDNGGVSYVCTACGHSWS